MKNIRQNDPESDKPMYLGKRRVQNNKGSRYVFLPKPWVIDNKLEAGDILEFSMDGDGVLCARKVEEPAPASKGEQASSSESGEVAA